MWQKELLGLQWEEVDFDSPKLEEGASCEHRLDGVLGSSHRPGPVALAAYLCPQDLLGLPSSRNA
jgi:hypothetical protein